MITIRKWRESDAPVIALHANNRKIFDNLRDGFPSPYSIEDAKRFIDNALKEDPKSILFAIDLEGEAIGSIGGTFKEDVYRKNVEIGYFIGEKHWGKGYIKQAINLIVQYIFENFDIERTYAEPYAGNTASRRALENCGFTCEATLRNYVFKNEALSDSCIYSILRHEYTTRVKGAL
jgi:[ribosomal protein S5]-alanine N-acetyltransferase